MDIEYQDVICVTTFKANAGGTVTHACVSSVHPAAEESSPVHRQSSSSHLTLSLRGRRPGCLNMGTAALTRLLRTEKKTPYAGAAHNSITPTPVTSKGK